MTAKLVVAFVAWLLVTAASPAMAFTPAGAGTITVITILGSSLKVDGTALNDMTEVRIYWSINGGAET